MPVVHVQRRSAVLGGAANVARNLRSLDVAVDLAGFVGHDGDAESLRAECRAHAIGMDAVVAIDEFCTVAKTRVLADDRQVVRFDDEIAAPRSEAESDLLLGAIRRLLESGAYCGVVLSDYAKGVCTPHLCAGLIAACRDRGAPVYVDPKGRDYRKYAGATAIKPNRIEMIELAQAMGWTFVGPVDAARQLREMLSLEFVALTLGAQGIAIVQADGVHEMPTVAREVFDVSGAGDTVMATMVAALGSGLPLMDSVALANLAAAEVIAHAGTTPVRREDLLLALQQTDRAHGARKRYTVEELKILVSAWKAQGLRVAITNGCFDLLHAGHVRLLEDSAAVTDRLIVAINSDDSITRLKGPQRPLMPADARCTVLSALECIDALVVFEEDTPLNVIEEVRPDILIKGGDYTVDTVVGADVVQSYGGEVRLVPLVEGLSTTRLADALRRL